MNHRRRPDDLAFNEPYLDRRNSTDRRVNFQRDRSPPFSGTDRYRPRYQKRKSSFQASDDSRSPHTGPPTPMAPAPTASMVASPIQTVSSGPPTGPQQMSEADRDDNEFNRLLSGWGNALLDMSTAISKLPQSQLKLKAAEKERDKHHKITLMQNGLNTAVQEAQAEIERDQQEIDRCSKAKEEKETFLACSWRRMRQSGGQLSPAAMNDLWDHVRKSDHDLGARLERSEKDQGQYLNDQIVSFDRKHNKLHNDVTMFGARVVALEKHRKEDADRAKQASPEIEGRLGELQKVVKKLDGAPRAKDETTRSYWTRLTEFEVRLDDITTKVNASSGNSATEVYSARVDDVARDQQTLKDNVDKLHALLKTIEDDVDDQFKQVQNTQTTELQQGFQNMSDAFDTKVEQAVEKVREQLNNELLSYKASLQAITQEQVQGLANENMQLKNRLGIVEGTNVNLSQQTKSLNEQISLLRSEQASQTTSLSRRVDYLHHSVVMPLLKRVDSINASKPVSNPQSPMPRPAGGASPAMNGVITPGSPSVPGNVALDTKFVDYDKKIRAIDENIYFLMDRYNNTTSEQVCDSFIAQAKTFYPLGKMDGLQEQIGSQRNVSHKHGLQIQSLAEELQKMKAAKDAQQQPQILPQSVPESGPNGPKDVNVDTEKIEELAARVDEIRQSMAKVQDTVDNIAYQKMPILDDVGERLTSLETSFEQAQAAASDIAKDRQASTESNGNLENDLSTIREKLSANEAIIEQLKKDRDNAQNTGQTTSTTIDQLTERIDAFSKRHSGLWEQVKKIAGMLDDTVEGCKIQGVKQTELQNTTEDLQNRLLTLDARVKKTEETSSTVETVRANYDSLRNHVNSHETSIKAVETSVGQSKQQIDKHESKTEKVIQEHKSDSNKRIDEHKKEVTSMLTKNHNEAATRWNEQAAQLTKRIDEHEQRTGKQADEFQSSVQSKVDWIDQVMHKAVDDREKTKGPSGQDFQTRAAPKGQTPRTGIAGSLRRISSNDAKKPGSSSRLHNDRTFDVDTSPPRQLGKAAPKDANSGSADVKGKSSISRPTTAGSALANTSNKRERSPSNVSTETKKRKLQPHKGGPKPKDTLNNTTNTAIDLSD